MAAEVREGFPERMMTEMSQVRTGGKWKKVVVVVARAIATERGTNMCNALMLKATFS